MPLRTAFLIPILLCSGVVCSAQNLSILTASPLPPTMVGSVYLVVLNATGGMPPYTWSVVIPGLPTGLALSPAGVLAGTPTAVGAATFTVQVTDSVASNTSKQFMIAVI